MSSNEKRITLNKLNYRKRDGSHNKGRQLDYDTLEEIKPLLSSLSTKLPNQYPIQRDLLIEALHLVQDDKGHLDTNHLMAIAELFNLSQVEVFEVASFYHHFDLIKEGDDIPAQINIRVCDSLSCSIMGADDLIEGLDGFIDKSKMRVTRVPCIGRCANAPAANVGKRAVDNATTEKVLEATNSDLSPEIPNYQSLDTYINNGGYQVLKSCLANEKSPKSLIETMSNAGLRGLGGAGFPAGQKWSIVRSFDGPRLMTINADEGEPGTFKDRHWLETEPHKMLEGALIAAWAVGCDKIYIYVRDEYPAVIEILKAEIERLASTGFSEHAPFEIRRGAGAYICGEESAMIESIEGKRGIPRQRPPYIAEVGLFDHPTLNHNVETLAWVPDILKNGAAWFSKQGIGEYNGLRSFSVSGRVKNPGIKLAPAGISTQSLIEDYSGGMLEGHTFKAFLPGGASGGIFPESMSDLPLEFGTFEKYGGFIGSHAVIILSDQDSISEATINLLNFFKHESCGQCTPCRAGTEKMVTLLEQKSTDIDLFKDLSQVMRDASICGLGQAASNPAEHLHQFFGDES